MTDDEMRDYVRAIRDCDTTEGEPNRPSSRIGRENRLRTITDRLVQSPDFIGGGDDRMERIQAAYSLAQKIDTALLWAWENP